MEIVLFDKAYKSDSIHNFTDFYYMLRLEHLASDLLDKGLLPKQINNAVSSALSAAKSSGLDIREHFKPVFSGMDKEIVLDCKLSHLGYGLAMMNADVELSVVGDFQISVLNAYLDTPH